MSHPLDHLRADARAILRAGVDAVDPYVLTRDALAGAHAIPSTTERIHLVAAGKAAWPMALGALAVLGHRVAAGVVAGPRGAGDLPAGIEAMPAGHPLPDAVSAAAGVRALELARDAGMLLVLLSGGGSAMLEVPAQGVALDDLRGITSSLLRSGADISRINAVRKHLSYIKGGRLAAAAERSATLAISDVHLPEDGPATIASGPTVADPTTYAEALGLIAALSPSEVPAGVRRHLERGAAGEIDETIKPGDPRLSASSFAVLANRRTAMAGAEREARRRGYVVRTVEPATRGEARDAGRLLAELAMATRPLAGPGCLVASGETTVTVRGAGRGGRNQEFVLGAVRTLSEARALAVVASIGTDGVDGPTDAAGALAASTTAVRAAAMGLDLEAFLAANDAYPALEQLGDLITWGPTLTNVGDVHIVLTMGG